MKVCLQVFRHELAKLLSDRKLLGAIFLMPLIIVSTTMFLTAPKEDPAVETYHIYVLGGASVQLPPADNVEVIVAEYQTVEELAGRVSLSASDVVLNVDDSGVTIYFNALDVVSQTLSGICERFFRSSALFRFAAADMVDISGLVSVEDVGSQTDSGSMLKAILLPYVLVLLLFQDTSGYAIHSIAGEKERGVFSKLLLAPVSPVPVICGKLFSSVVCGMMSSGVYILVVLLSAVVTGEDTFGLLDAGLTPAMAFLLVLCASVLSVFFAALSVLCSLFAKTVKEAQAMRLPVYGVTMVLALLSIFRSGTVPPHLYGVPIYNACIVMQDVLSSSVEIRNMLITLLSFFVSTCIVGCIAIHSFKKEQIRF